MTRGPCGECGQVRRLIDEITTTCGFVEFVCADCLNTLTKKTETTMTKKTTVEWTRSKFAAHSWAMEDGAGLGILAVVHDGGSFCVADRAGRFMKTGQASSVAAAKGQALSRLLEIIDLVMAVPLHETPVLPDPSRYCSLHDAEWDPGEFCSECAAASQYGPTATKKPKQRRRFGWNGGIGLCSVCDPMTHQMRHDPVVTCCSKCGAKKGGAK